MDEQALQKIDDVMKIQLDDPASKTDPYMKGMANGMILVRALIVGEEPKFIE